MGVIYSVKNYNVGTSAPNVNSFNLFSNRLRSHWGTTGMCGVCHLWIAGSVTFHFGPFWEGCVQRKRWPKGCRRVECVFFFSLRPSFPPSCLFPPNRCVGEIYTSYSILNVCNVDNGKCHENFKTEKGRESMSLDNYSAERPWVSNPISTTLYTTIPDTSASPFTIRKLWFNMPHSKCFISSYRIR